MGASSGKNRKKRKVSKVFNTPTGKAGIITGKSSMLLVSAFGWSNVGGLVRTDCGTLAGKIMNSRMNSLDTVCHRTSPNCTRVWIMKCCYNFSKVFNVVRI